MTRDSILIKECLQDSDQYAVLVDRYKNMVYTVAYRIVGDSDVANDIAQESFISAYGGLRNFKGDSKFSSWLYAIVLNKCRDYLRSRRENISLDELGDITANHDPSPEAQTASHETGDMLQAALNLLPTEYREVIVLKHVEGLEYQEISGILSANVNALKVRAYRGREMLRKLLEKAGVNHG